MKETVEHYKLEVHNIQAELDKRDESLKQSSDTIADLNLRCQRFEGKIVKLKTATEQYKHDMAQLRHQNDHY